MAHRVIFFPYKSTTNLRSCTRMIDTKKAPTPNELYKKLCPIDGISLPDPTHQPQLTRSLVYLTISKPCCAQKHSGMHAKNNTTKKYNREIGEGKERKNYIVHPIELHSRVKEVERISTKQKKSVQRYCGNPPQSSQKISQEKSSQKSANKPSQVSPKQPKRMVNKIPKQRLHQRIDHSRSSS